MREEIADRFAKPVVSVVYTHHHQDHVNGAQAFAATVQDVIAHTNAVPHLRAEGLVTVMPTQTFAENLVVTLGGKSAELRYLGPRGHSDDSVVVYFPDERVLFVVDIVGVNRIPHRYLGSGTLDKMNDVDGWISVLSRIEAMDFDILVPGHLQLGTVGDVRMTREYLLSLRTQVAALQSKGRTLAQMITDVDLSDYSKLTFYEQNLSQNIEAMAHWLQRPAENTFSSEIAFVVLGKKHHFRQDADGDLAFLNYFFFTNIVPARGGKLERAYFIPPGKTRIDYPPSHGRRTFFGAGFGEKRWLDLAYPPGTYRLNITTPSGSLNDIRLTLGSQDFVAPPVITLVQEGKAVAVNRVDPGKALTFSWTQFDGNQDPRGILDDLVLIGIYGCRNEIVAFLGRPNDGKNIISFQDTEYVFEADRLEPGQTYAMFLEHALLTDTGRHHECLSIAALASQTYLDFKTTGVAAPDRHCPDTMPQFEPGQTDRHSAEHALH